MAWPHYPSLTLERSGHFSVLFTCQGFSREAAVTKAAEAGCSAGLRPEGAPFVPWSLPSQTLFYSHPPHVTSRPRATVTGEVLANVGNHDALSVSFSVNTPSGYSKLRDRSGGSADLERQTTPIGHMAPEARGQGREALWPADTSICCRAGARAVGIP